MADRETSKMTEWLDIHLDTLSSEERIRLIEEICDSLTPRELLTVRDVAERSRHSKLEDARAALLEEMRGKASELGLSLNDVFPPRRPRKSKPPFVIQGDCGTNVLLKSARKASTTITATLASCRTSRSHPYKLLNLLSISNLGYIVLKNNKNRINGFQRGAECASCQEVCALYWARRW
jgi:hypothetical protein